MNIVGVVLAGGQSKRMGGAHKGMLKLKTKALSLHVLDRLSIQTEEIILNVNVPVSYTHLTLPTTPYV